MADQNLTVKITAEGTAIASAGVADFEQRLLSLEAAYGRTVAASKGHQEASHHNTLAHRVEKEAAEGLGGALDALATHYRAVTAGSELFGIEATGAAAKVAALTEVIEGLEKACLPLLLALAALEVAFKGFEFIKEGIDGAAKMQASLETLGAAVRAQGGDWKEAQESIEKFAEAESLAAGYATTELVAALNTLVTAGHDVHDSEQMLSVATELARSKHIALEEAVQYLISAEAGRARGLVQLDGSIKQIVDSHGKMSDILKQLHKDMGGAITDADGLEMNQARLHATMDAIAESIGKLLLPMLNGMAVTMLGAIKNAEDLGSAIVHAFTSMGMAIAHAADMAGHFGAGLGALAFGDFKTMSTEFQAAADADNAAMDSMSKSAENFGKAFHEVFQGQDAYARGKSAIDAAIKEHAERVGEIKLDKDLTIGKPKTGSSAGQSGFSVTHADMPEQPGKIDEYARAQRDLETQLKANNGAEKTLAEAIKLATTASGQRAAQSAYDARVLADLTEKQHQLQDALAGENDMRRILQGSQRASYDEQVRATQAYNDYQDAMAKAGTNSIAEQNHLAELKAAMDSAKKSTADYQKQIDELTGFINKNTTALAANQVALDGAKDKTAEAAAAMSRAREKFNSDEAQRIGESAATWNATNAQKVAIYARMLAALNAGDIDYEKKREELTRKGHDAQIASLKDQEKAHDEWVKQMSAKTASLIDGIVVQHRSMRDELRSIYDEILKSFIDMVAKMIVESALFGKAFGGLGGGGASGGGGLFGSLVAGIGGGGGSAPNGTSSNPIHVVTADAGSAFLDKVTGSPSGVTGLPSTVGGAGGSVGAGGVLGLAALAYGAGSAIGGAEGGGSHSTFGGIGAVAGLAGAGAIGLAAGASGGLAGGIAALAAAGPVGWAVLAGGVLLGGAAGGMFGAKATNAHDNPDQAGDVNSYAAFVANMTGGDNEHFGNVTKSADQQYNIGAGNKPLAQQLGDYVNGLTSTAGMTQAQKDAIAKLKSLEGAGKSDGLDIASEKNGVFTLSSGKTISVSDYQALIANVQGAAGGSVGGPIPTFAVSRSYGDYNASTLAANGSTPAHGVTGTPPVNIVVNGNVVGTNGMTELATIVGQTMYDQQRGTGPTGGRQGMFSRNGGSF